MSAPPYQISRLSGQRVAPVGRITHFRPLSKDNTGMAALRAGLPVIKSYNTTTGFEHTTYAIKPKHLAHWAMAAVGDIGLKVQYKLVHVRYTPARA